MHENELARRKVRRRGSASPRGVGRRGLRRRHHFRRLFRTRRFWSEGNLDDLGEVGPRNDLDGMGREAFLADLEAMADRRKMQDLARRALVLAIDEEERALRGRVHLDFTESRLQHHEQIVPASRPEPDFPCLRLVAGPR